MRIPTSPYPMQKVVSFPIPAQSPASIAAARAEMFAERQRNGIYTIEILCPKCGEEIEGIGFSEGDAEGHAVRQIVKHLVAAHPIAGVTQ